MGTQHHAVVGIDVDESQAHDLQLVLDGTCASRPETTDMRSLLSRLADIAGGNGYRFAVFIAEVADGQGGVEAEPVQVLQAQASDICSPCLP